MAASSGGSTCRACGRVAFLPTAAVAMLLAGGLGAAHTVASPAGVLREGAPGAQLATRALWVLRGTLTTPARIDQLTRQAASSGFNTLFVQVRARGDAYFTGSPEPRGDGLPAGFDPLGYTLTAAHRAGLRVHAWVNVNLVASAVHVPDHAAHVVRSHPEWLMVPRELAASLAAVPPGDARYLSRLAGWTRERAGRVEGLYVSPVPVEAARYLESIVGDLAARYAVDGVHLDYVRYPGPQFDHSAAALAAFRQAIWTDVDPAVRARLDARLAREPLVYTDYFSARWVVFRRARLADLVARLRRVVKTHRPGAWVSAAVVPDVVEASRDRLQDWPEWARRGLVDAVCPMAYTTDLPRFTRQIGDAGAASGGQPVWAGIGAYRLTPSETVSRITAARTAGARGIVLFSYDSLTADDRPDALGAIGRSAFGGDLGADAGSR